MKARKLIGRIHLWLGLASGLIVAFLGITGCILAFEIEIRGLTESFRKVEVRQKDFLPPSVLKAVAEKHLHSGKALGIEYPGRGKAAVAAYYDENENYELVFMDPYTGDFIRHKNMNTDFFRVVLDGHFYLWLPPKVGQPIVATATLIFLIMMITGLVLWWPRNKAARKQRFSVRWSAKWKRKNYDLHNVLGFYMTWVAIFLAISGLVFGFEWFARSVYWVTSGGDQMVPHAHPVSDTTRSAFYANIADHLWSEHKGTVHEKESLGVYFANVKTDPVEIVINHRPGTYYNSDFFHYDQFTGTELEAPGSYSGRFKDARLADKIVRMNYDIHVGAVLGLPGKILAFFASLIAASLPVTGFLIWRGRRKKAKAIVSTATQDPRTAVGLS
jgi:uncharacterized iron-regulated membrane protein